MDQKIKEQTLALAGVMQAASLVDELARKGQIDEQELTTAVDSILNTDPSSVVDVFGHIPNLRIGLTSLRALLSREGQGVAAETIRYGMSLLHIEGKLRKRKDLMEQLSKGIERTQGQLEYFDSHTHESVVGSLANTYLDSVSHLNFRIQVTGNPTLLQDDRIASRIRAVLLFGIRSAILWQQVGGKRWHFIVQRGRLLSAARELQTRGLH